MFRRDIPSIDSIDQVARQVLDSFPGNRIFALFGEMGAGKTTFIKALCRELGVIDITSSPSFGLIHEYYSEDGSPIYHFDFYRIEALEEVFDIGYEEYLYSGDYCFMEWPEMVESLLPEDTIRLSIRSDENGSRILEHIDPNSLSA